MSAYDPFRLPDETHAWGRVSGKTGQRVPLYKASPQRCARETEDGCSYTSRAHVDASNNREGIMALIGIAGTNRQEFYQDFGFGASIQNPAQLVQLLLAHGANVEARDAHGETALFHTIDVNNVDVAAVLLEAHANPNAARDIDRPE
jgi:hypothetical protein